MHARSPLPRMREEPSGGIAVEPIQVYGGRSGSAMILLDAYQQRVSDCLQSVERSRDVEERTAWRELALCWLRLSDHAEQFRRKATHSEGIRAGLTTG